ncbi:hypothetical protein Tco_0309423 [Tanacetum coccineum]
MQDLWNAIKANLWRNEASKKMQKNLAIRRRSQGLCIIDVLDALEVEGISEKRNQQESCLDFEKVSYVEELSSISYLYQILLTRGIDLARLTFWCNIGIVQLFMNKQLEGVDDLRTLYRTSVSLPSIDSNSMQRRKDTKVLVLILGSCKFCKGCSSTPTQSGAAFTRTASVQEYCFLPHGTATPDYDSGAVSSTGYLTRYCCISRYCFIPKSPHDLYSHRCVSTSGGDEGLLDRYALNREVRDSKANPFRQANPNNQAQSKCSRNYPNSNQPVDQHHAFWTVGEEASNVKSGETEELDLETTQSTARQVTITPRTLNFEDEAGPSSPLRPNSSPIQSHLHLNNHLQATVPGKTKGKGILVEEPKKKKLTLQQIRALETTNDEEVARKIQAEWDAEEERKRKREAKRLLRKRKATLAEDIIKEASVEKQYVRSPISVVEDYIIAHSSNRLRRFHESSGVHTLRDRRCTNDSTMLAERRYPLSREFEDKDAISSMEVEDENETAIT